LFIRHPPEVSQRQQPPFFPNGRFDGLGAPEPDMRDQPPILKGSAGMTFPSVGTPELFLLKPA